MKKIFAAPLALVASAFVLVACSTEGPSSRIGAPDGLSPDIGVAAASVVQVCLDSESSAGSYSFALSNFVDGGPGDTPASSPQTLTDGPVTTCFIAYTRNGGAGGGDLDFGSVTVTASRITPTGETPVTGTFSYTCVDDVVTDNLLCNNVTSGVNGATGKMNSPHGSTITFLFVADAPPPAVLGCTVTRGFILNQLDLITNNVGPAISVTINGQLLTTAQIRAALEAPTKGDSRVQLKAQLITALANISLGATSNTAVNTAIADAQAYLLAGSTATKAQISAAIDTLTSFNEGTAGNGASDHCNDEEEAILKDKAPVPT